MVIDLYRKNDGQVVEDEWLLKSLETKKIIKTIILLFYKFFKTKALTISLLRNISMRFIFMIFIVKDYSF